MEAQENKSQISQNDILHMKFSEFYLRFLNSREIWHLFSRALKNAKRLQYFVHWKLKFLSFLVDFVLNLPLWPSLIIFLSFAKFSIRAGGRQNSPTISCELAAFCSRMLEMLSKRPRFQIFSGMSLDPPGNSCFWHLQVTPVARVFSFTAYSKVFATYLKPYWKPWCDSVNMVEQKFVSCLVNLIID